jgi:hypothetical protein
MRSLLACVRADARDRVRRYSIGLLLAALAALIATTGLAMLVGSAFLCLAESMTVQAAAAVTGGGLLVAAGLVAVTARLLSRSRSRRSTGGAAARESTGGNTTGIADLLASVETAIGRGARSEAPGLALMALLAGCAIGASPSLRQAIVDLALFGRRAE